MQSSYQYHYGSGGSGSSAPTFGSTGGVVFGGGVDWGMGAGSGAAFQPSGGAGFALEVGVYEKQGSSVREYAYSEDKNYRFRPAMEDTYAIRDKLGNDPNCGLFAVFDGHGGKQVADHCAERIPEEMRKEVMKTPGDLSHTLDSVFLKIDNELRLLDADQTGSTGCVCVVRTEFGHKVLYVANVGDTRAVLSKNGIAERMSQDHKATDQSEVDRIRNGGGIVFENRVGGSLAVTRAFGDHSLKKDGVIAKPYINKLVLRPSDKFLVIASDGVWDVLNDQDAVNLCKEEQTSKEIAQAIVKVSLDKGSKDNISVLVIRFNSTSPF